MNADCGILSVALMRAVELATLQAHLITVEQDRLPTFFLPIRTSILPGGGGGGEGGGGGGGGGGGDLETKETSQ